jgi:MFS family permease
MSTQIRATFASLHYLNYRLWFFAALISNLGAWIQRIGQDWLVLRILTNGNGMAPATVTALQFIPVIALTPYAGLLADRLPRRKLLIATQAGQGVLAFALGTLTLTGRVQLWHVFVLAFLLGCVTAIDGPVRQTFVTEMVPGEMLPNAVGLNSASFNSSRLVGPALAGLLITAFGTGWAFIINGASFVATIVGLSLMRTNKLYATPKAPREKGQIRQALEYVKGRRDLQMIFIVMGVISCLGFNSQLSISLMATKVFDKGAGQFGLLSPFFAIGARAGALRAARRKHPRLRLILTAGVGFGVFSAISAVMPTYATFGIAGIFVGLCTLTLMTGANSTVQMSTSPHMRGRVVALYLLVFQGVGPVGSLTIGWIAQHISTRSVSGTV